MNRFIVVGAGFSGGTIARTLADAGCTVLLVYNKWDLVEEREQAWKRLIADRARRYPTLARLPSVPVSAVTHTHLGRLPEHIRRRVDAHRRRIRTPELNRWLQESDVLR